MEYKVTENNWVSKSPQISIVYIYGAKCMILFYSIPSIVSLRFDSVSVEVKS